MATAYLKRKGRSLALAAFAAAWAGLVSAQQFTVTLSGAQEVPPVTTSASGTARVTVAPDGGVTGTIQTKGIEAAAAHIHTGAAGANGPVIVPFTKGADSTWATAPGAKLDAGQLEALKKGGLYVNVHSKAHPGGEIRAQLVP